MIYLTLYPVGPVAPMFVHVSEYPSVIYHTKVAMLSQLCCDVRLSLTTYYSM